jgi:hypothetical protein
MDKEVKAIDLRRHKKEKVPNTPLRTRYWRCLPLSDVPREERIGQRITPPKRKRTKAISVIGSEVERILMNTSAIE